MTYSSKNQAWDKTPYLPPVDRGARAMDPKLVATALGLRGSAGSQETLDYLLGQQNQNPTNK